ncbi:hypothetical protein ACFOY2_25735 [Nonomuraea purpurea]|uniref:Uncharacterized protein n=1 Tax=Nonomuraea purpurea TaxID=1849276 RepID=A0ABV8G9I6_9ACTN
MKVSWPDLVTEAAGASTKILDEGAGRDWSHHAAGLDWDGTVR